MDADEGGAADALLLFVTVIVVVTVEVPGATRVGLAVAVAETGRPTSKSVFDDCPGSGVPSLVSRETWSV